MGDAYKLPADGSSAGSLYGLAWSHPNAGGIAGNLNTHGLLVMENGTFLAAISGNIKARDGIIAGSYMFAPNYIETNGPMYATIMYDNNDRSFYVDPNSTSRLNAVVYNDLKWAGDQSYGFLGRNLYADTINGRGSDPLEINYYDGGDVRIGTGVNGSKGLYAGALYDAGSRVITSANIGSQSVNYANYSGYTSGYSTSVELAGGNYIWFNGSGYHNVRMYESYGVTINCISHPWHFQVLNGSIISGFQPSGGNYGIGNGYFTGDVTAYYSDKRLKHELKPIENAVSKILSLTGYTYKHNKLGEELLKENPNKVHAGLVAQEVEAVLPEVVTIAPFDLDGYDENGKGVSRSGENYLTIKYERIVPLLIEGIKEQQVRIESQQLEIAELKDLVKQLLAK
jgi:hypothetical protein